MSTLLMGCFVTVSILFVLAVFFEVVYAFLQHVDFETTIQYILITIGLYALFVILFAMALFENV